MPPPELNANLPPISTRGENALQGNPLISTVRLDLDHSIMIWHIATNICDRHDDANAYNPSEERIASKKLSDFMMYLLVMKPSMISPNASFWFDAFSGYIINFCKGKNFAQDDERTVIQKLLDNVKMQGTIHDQNSSSFDSYSKPLILTILQSVENIVSDFSSRSIGWDKMKLVWLEMLHYAAIHCPHVCHLEELKEGGEFLTIHWRMVNYRNHAALNEDFEL